jgi:hypothetical protein
MKVVKYDPDLSTLAPTDHQDKQHSSELRYSPDQPRDDHGRFGEGDEEEDNYVPAIQKDWPDLPGTSRQEVVKSWAQANKDLGLDMQPDGAKGLCGAASIKLWDDVFSKKEGYSLMEADGFNHVWIGGYGLAIDPTAQQFNPKDSLLSIKKASEPLYSRGEKFDDEEQKQIFRDEYRDIKRDVRDGLDINGKALDFNK